MAEPRTRIDGVVHALAPARERLTPHGWLYGYDQLMCPTRFDPDTAPPLPANTPVTCPRCQRALNTKEN